MRNPQSRRARAPRKRPAVSVSVKLQEIMVDIRNTGNVGQTRLTILKKWFEVPGRAASFGIVIATHASQRTEAMTAETAPLYREAQQLLAQVDIFRPEIPRQSAQDLHARLREFQNERRNVHWTTIRIINDHSLFLIEAGLGLYLHCDDPAAAYRVARSYCENYDARYGSGLNGPSLDRIEEISGFAVMREAYEADAHGETCPRD
jgi:hypothetical protein